MHAASAHSDPHLLLQRHSLRFLRGSLLRSALCFLVLPAALCSAQRADVGETSSAAALPDAPAAAPASVTGTVLDINSGVVPGARLTLTDAAHSFTREAVADADGRFSFDGVPPGAYTLSIAAQGLETYTSAPFVLAPGERHELPRVALPIARATADVEVTVSQVELATEQIHAAEKQRVLGVLPNFYTSYIWKAAPLNARQKYGLAFHAILDPTAFLGAGFAAGVQQATDTFSGYGQGAAGYGKRFGAAYADGAIGILMGDAILASALHEDPRYFYKGSGTNRSRVKYALTRAFICRSDSGRDVPNYSHLVGGLIAGGISNAYYPSGDRGVGLTFTNWGAGIGADMAGGLIREYVLPHLVHNVPTYAKGKP